jgi:hypothetical protein
VLLRKIDHRGIRITAILFFKLFWVVEKTLFFLPLAPIKIWLGLWIMLPNFHVRHSLMKEIFIPRVNSSCTTF